MKGGKELTEEDVLSFLGYLTAFLAEVKNRLTSEYMDTYKLMYHTPSFKPLPRYDRMIKAWDYEFKGMNRLDLNACESAVKCLVDSAITNTENILGIKWLDIKSWLEAHKP